MPTRTCTCTTSKCGLVEGGVELDIRTYNNHLRKDREFFAAKLAEDSKRVLDDEIEKVGQHFASLAVSDSIPTPSSASGERLWSQPGDREGKNFSVPQSSNPCSSRQQIICNLLSRLAEIESAVDVLSVDVATKLEKLSTIPPADAFPLRHHHAECVRIQTDLSKVVYTASSVTVMKRQVSDKVDDIAKKLEEAKLSWIREMKISNSRQETKTPDIKVSTGKMNHNCIC
ncbi:hypothetical protein CPB84DRAFT_1747942 [Gymnopilus junonius]|uniref:Uncharacterized protein n=1 Tax=Gymnopilus junonius TaxID=109634 RepID=A0A9P5NM85_GYMJU|nr:hypothetical protein CPB84DRAFT_1747942 [Gymnopilus junonius]